MKETRRQRKQRVAEEASYWRRPGWAEALGQQDDAADRVLDDRIEDADARDLQDEIDRDRDPRGERLAELGDLRYDEWKDEERGR